MQRVCKFKFIALLQTVPHQEVQRNSMQEQPRTPKMSPTYGRSKTSMRVRDGAIMVYHFAQQYAVIIIDLLVQVIKK